MARKTRLSPKMQENICALIASGVPASTACALVGISRSSYYMWLSDPKRKAFTESIEKAQAQFEAELSMIVMRATSDKRYGPEHAKWLLERRFPERHGGKTRMSVEHTGAGGGPVKIDFAALTIEELEAIARGSGDKS